MAKKVNNVNVVEFSGVVTKIVAQTNNVTKVVVDNQKTSKNDKIIHTYMTVILFAKNEEIEVGDKVHAIGTLSTSTYNGKFRVDIVADELAIE